MDGLIPHWSTYPRQNAFTTIQYQESLQGPFCNRALVDYISKLFQASTTFWFVLMSVHNYDSGKTKFQIMGTSSPLYLKIVRYKKTVSWWFWMTIDHFFALKSGSTSCCSFSTDFSVFVCLCENSPLHNKTWHAPVQRIDCFLFALKF